MLRFAHKWTRFPSASIPTNSSSKQVRLADLFTIKRGLATGANEFFILSRQRVEEIQIPKEFRYLGDNEIMDDGVGSPLLKRQLFLLNCNLPEEAIKSRYPTLWRYLEYGMAKGIHERYLCRHRKPWYSQEVRRPSMFLCTYMGRQGTGAQRPFRFLLNHSQATAANTYLVMYPKPNLLRTVRGRPERIRAVWQALNRITPEMLVQEGRVYGGGLHKMEPKELANTPADGILTALNTLLNPSEADGALSVVQMAFSLANA
jgi:adenine-specific DNA-methyltransferase